MVTYFRASASHARKRQRAGQDELREPRWVDFDRPICADDAPRRRAPDRHRQRPTRSASERVTDRAGGAELRTPHGASSRDPPEKEFHQSEKLGGALWRRLRQADRKVEFAQRTFSGSAHCDQDVP